MRCKRYLGIVIFVTSSYLIISGVSKKEISVKLIKKRNLIFGIVLIIISFVASFPDMKESFIRGFNAGSDVQIEKTSE